MPTLSRPRLLQHPTAPLAAVVLLALALRLAAVLWLSDTIPYSDYFYYHEAGRLQAKDWTFLLQRSTVQNYGKLNWWPPGYPVFLAAIYTLVRLAGRIYAGAQDVDVALAGGASAKFIAAGANHTCAVASSGGVQCWGSNTTAQLGLPTTTASSLVPVEVPSFPPPGSTVTEVAAGAGHSCVVLQDVSSLNTSAVCWGANDKGQVGISPTPFVVTPTVVPNLSGSAVVDISTQLDHTCVVKSTNGQVSCWGWNLFGQTGQSPSPNPSVPGATVSSLTVTAISVGGTHTCAIGVVNNKTTAARLIPAPGKRVGDTVHFGGLLGSAPVMALPSAATVRSRSSMGRWWARRNRSSSARLKRGVSPSTAPPSVQRTNCTR